MANVTAFCNECGATRTASAQGIPHSQSRSLRCAGCNRATPHVRLHTPGDTDYGEEDNARRLLKPYDPEADLAKRWPGWKLYRMPLADCGFSILKPSKAILIDTAWAADDPWLERFTLAFVIAHLDLHFASVGADERFSDKQVDDAEQLAMQRMDQLTPATPRQS